MIEQQERQRIVRAASYIMAIGEATAPEGGRTLTAPTGRQAVPAGPFIVLGGSAVVEFDGSDSLVFLRSGMVCDFGPQAGASWVVAEPLTVQEVGRCPRDERVEPSAQHANDGRAA